MVAMSLANGLLWGLGLMEAWLMKDVVAAAANWLEVWNGVAESVKQRRDALLHSNGINSGVEGECRLAKQRI